MEHQTGTSPRRVVAAIGERRLRARERDVREILAQYGENLSAEDIEVIERIIRLVESSRREIERRGAMVEQCFDEIMSLLYG